MEELLPRQISASCQSMMSIMVMMPTKLRMSEKSLDNELESFLQLEHVALAARHYPSHRCAVVEGRRHLLQVVEHLGAK